MKKIYGIHGDVTLVKVLKLPTGVKPIKYVKNFILEKGEGVHTHIIESQCELYEVNGVMYLKSDKEIILNHEEHGMQVLEPGIYRKEMERAFDYEDMEAKQVQD
jgi:hypothetical protein